MSASKKELNSAHPPPPNLPLGPQSTFQDLPSATFYSRNLGGFSRPRPQLSVPIRLVSVQRADSAVIRQCAAVRVPPAIGVGERERDGEHEGASEEVISVDKTGFFPPLAVTGCDSTQVANKDEGICLGRIFATKVNLSPDINRELARPVPPGGEGGGGCLSNGDMRLDAEESTPDSNRSRQEIRS